MAESELGNLGGPVALCDESVVSKMCPKVELASCGLESKMFLKLEFGLVEGDFIFVKR